MRNVAQDHEEELAPRCGGPGGCGCLPILVHEICTPVTVMRAHADALAEAGVAGAPALARASARLGRLLDAARAAAAGSVRPPTLCELCLACAVRSCLDESAGVVAPGHPLDLRCDVHARVWADLGMVEQVVLNLVGNAAKFSPAGSAIEVEVEADHATVSLVVRDRGPGIPADQVTRAFVPFVRLDEHVPGLGVGLHVAATIVRAHHGDLRYHPRPGGGAVLEASFPRGAA